MVRRTYFKSKVDTQLRVIFDITSSLGLGIFFGMYQDFKGFNDITIMKIFPFLYIYLHVALTYKSNLRIQKRNLELRKVKTIKLKTFQNE